MPAKVTVVIPSYNQRAYLEDAIRSVLNSGVDYELIIMDGGSTDGSVDVIKKYDADIFYWQSQTDNGQSAAINAGMKLGSAPYVCWINSDDFYLEKGLQRLVDVLDANPEAVFVYGKTWNVTISGKKANPYFTFPFSERLLANYCFVSQPGTLIRRSAWDAVDGVSESLGFAMDYDLWWKLYQFAGKPVYLREFVAANRMHGETKTHNHAQEHYNEAIQVVRQNYGEVPVKWRTFRPILIGLRKLIKFARKIG